MDSNTAKVFERSVEKLQFLGLVFCGLYAGKLTIDLVKFIKLN